MPKKIKNCFYKNLTFEKLMQAHKRARKNKVYKKEVINFEFNLENNIINLMNSIKNNTYNLGKYFEFTVYEPKERKIKALPYKDRIVHQWYVQEFIKPFIVPKFIYYTFACLENKGTHKAVNMVQKYMRIYQRNYKSFWVLKCDIRKFFDSINPYILYNILNKHISDKALLSFTKLLIFSGRENEVSGIPIGNYSSQFFANIYLNELDQYVKRVLHIKAYVRYMDDFIILLKTKEDCIRTKELLINFLRENLNLELNDKSRYYPYKMGVNFCGYRIFTTHRLLRTSNKIKIKAKIKKWNKLYRTNNLDILSAMKSINSWLGHSSHCNSYKLQQKMFNNCEFIYSNNTSSKILNNLNDDIEKYKPI